MNMKGMGLILFFIANLISPHAPRIDKGKTCIVVPNLKKISWGSSEYLFGCSSPNKTRPFHQFFYLLIVSPTGITKAPNFLPN